MNEFMKAGIEEAEKGLHEGGIPIGSVLALHGRIIGRGHNRRVQKGSVCFTGKWMRWKTRDVNGQLFTENALYTRRYRHVQCVQARSCSTGSPKW